ncbi:C40 family peptidase [Planococcus lenghuensis]|uniref:Peptidoglycan endopeptidase n=1 Tax=Planococcus lenghuensis TaxID=2213202 RepID=A0A1Q2L1E4_9BACL|nr:peptidoglycan endopeptidase [Planococcus lenghuensis]AQQ54251.1 hypothetical protein B0X71_14865 [Planococcus lenghuensis]
MNKKTLSVAASVILSIALSANSVSASNYTVQSGDTLWGIAHKHSISVSALKQWNSLTDNTIVPNQQLRVSVDSTAPAASPSVPAAPVSSGTYTVKSGDTLYRIALESGSSLVELRQWNNLQTDVIYVGQQLKVSSSSAPAPASPAPAAPAPAPAPAPVSSNIVTYRVAAGDTLNRIAGKYSVSVSSLKTWNSLTSDLIYIGQSLKINGTAAAVPAPASPPEVAGESNRNPISIATPLLGAPYAWGGTTPAGFDCSGFIYYVYKQAGSSMGRTNTTGYYNYAVSVTAPQLGDLVFFRDTYRSGISHMGIYLGNREFIHAGSSGGVQVSSLDNSYWKSKFDSFKRFN